MYLKILVTLFQSWQKTNVNDMYLKILDKLLSDKSLITAKENKLDSLKRLVYKSSDPFIKYDKEHYF